MKTINRRELTHNVRQTLDSVASTGEPVEVPTPGGGRSVILVAGGSPTDRYQSMIAAGLVRPARTPIDWATVDARPVPTVDGTIDELLDDIKGAW